MKNAFKILIGKPDRNRPILIRRPRWEDNIKLDVIERGREDVD